MKERELTGNKMIEMVKEECERSLGKLEDKGKTKKGVLYLGYRNGKVGYYKEKLEGVESKDNKDFGKYEGEMKNGVPNGQGTSTYTDGGKYVGEFKDGKFHGQGTKTWSDGMYVGKYRDGKLSTGIFYDKNRNISFKVVNGRMIKQ